MKPHNKTSVNLLNYFKRPKLSRQKQYEAVRAFVLDNQAAQVVASRFGYTLNTLYTLIRNAKAGRLELFPSVEKGPRQRHTSLHVQQKIIALRQKNLATPDIAVALKKEGFDCSAKTVERILKELGFSKLNRRTHKQLGKSVRNKLLPESAQILDFKTLEPFTIDCPSVGVYFFLSYIIESNILSSIKTCELPGSSEIGNIEACLSMLLLKLMGCKRLSHIGAYDKEPGLGVFAGLTNLPKATYMTTYSCRCSEIQLLQLQEKIVSGFQSSYPDFYKGDFINLDFHSIPHYGNESQMEKVWCGAKGRSMKGANTVFAQDSHSQAIIYTRTDILRSEEANEVKKFVAYWKKVHGKVDETLVFDCKFTTYGILDGLANDNILFITLRKRNKTLINNIMSVPKKEWRRVSVPIPKRKYTQVSVYESEVKLTGCKHTFRQIVITDHGRIQPTFIVTNNRTLALEKILEVYAKRWRIENKLAELITFFNLNALSSPLMIRIQFDVLFTMIADTLYHRLAKDLRRFELARAPQLFRKFIDMPGRVCYDGENFKIKIRKRAHAPILLGVEKLNKPIHVPWLQNKTVEIIWTA